MELHLHSLTILHKQLYLYLDPSSTQQEAFVTLHTNTLAGRARCGRGRRRRRSPGRCDERGQWHNHVGRPASAIRMPWLHSACLTYLRWSLLSVRPSFLFLFVPTNIQAFLKRFASLSGGKCADIQLCAGTRVWCRRYVGYLLRVLTKCFV